MSEKDFVDLLNEETKSLIENLPQVKELKRTIQELELEQGELQHRIDNLTVENAMVVTYKNIAQQSKNEIASLKNEIENLTNDGHSIRIYAEELRDTVTQLKEKLHWIWLIGCDYDGCNTVESLKELIDEMVKITQMSMEEFENTYSVREVK